MSIKDQENIDELRKRLYERGGDFTYSKNKGLTRENFDVSRNWNTKSEETSEKTAIDNQPNNKLEKVNLVKDFVIEASPVVEKRSYRFKIVFVSLIFLLLAVVSSGLYMFFGSNKISNDNIGIAINTPFAIAGGEIMSHQVSVTNQNAVAIESATMIINYPSGTKTSDDDPKDLYETRISLDKIEPGQVINLPIKARLFGEENEEKEIKATIEYRIVNSNGTFFKDATPVFVKINSVPLSIKIESVNKISSGQEMDVEVKLQSNSTSPIKNILLTGSFPNSFAVIKSEPSAEFEKNTWFISEILPEKTYTIKIRGLVTGLVGEKPEMQFKVGNAKASNQYELETMLVEGKIDYFIEEPFINVKVGVNGDNDGLAIVSSSKEDSNRVFVEVVNTLKNPVYDMRIEVIPQGNNINKNNISVDNGFFESTLQKIIWETSGMKELEMVKSGETRVVNFTIGREDAIYNETFNISVKVFARRINEDNASEEMIGVAVADVKFSSALNLIAEVGHSSNPFDDRGPIPPVAGKSTDYTLTFEVKAGVNDIEQTVLTTSLPQYVTWKNKTEGGGKIEFNPTTKRLTWEIGDIKANQSKQIKMQVSLLPSVTHIGKELNLIENQEFKAIDSFTKETLSVSGKKLTTKLSAEQGFSEADSRVVED